MGLLLLVSGLGLLVLPGLGRRWARRLAPAEWSWLCAGALMAGAALTELAAILFAAPTVLRSLGVDTLASACQRVLGALAPGGPLVGWTAMGVALAIPCLAGRGIVLARRAARDARIEPWLGEHRVLGSHDLVVLPTDDPVALSVAGPPSQIIVSRGLAVALSSDEMASVLCHEAAHLTHRHQRFLLLATAVEHGLAFVAPVRASAAALRVGLERWADEEAVDAMDGDRAALRSALLGVTGMLVAADLAAFSPAGTIVERVEALSAPPVDLSRLRRVGLYAPGVVLGVGALVALSGWAGHAQMLVTMGGACPV